MKFRMLTPRTIALAALVAGSTLTNHFMRSPVRQTASSSVVEAAEQPEVKTVSTPKTETIESIVDGYKLPKHVATYLKIRMADAFEVEQKYGIPAAGVLTKAASEHSFATEGTPVKYHNHFGMKCKPEFGKKYECITAKSWEKVPSNKVTDNFVVYQSAHDSYMHFGEFLRERATNKDPKFALYRDVVMHPNDPEAFLQALAASPYSDRNNDEYSYTLGILRDNRIAEIVARVRKFVYNGEEAPKIDLSEVVSDSEESAKPQEKPSAAQKPTPKPKVPVKPVSPQSEYTDLHRVNRTGDHIFTYVPKSGDTKYTIAQGFNKWDDTGKDVYGRVLANDIVESDGSRLDVVPVGTKVYIRAPRKR